MVIGTDCTCSCKSNFYTITTAATQCRDIYNVVLNLWLDEHNQVFPFVGSKFNVMKRNLLTVSCHPPVFSGVRVTQSLVLCVCFVDRYLFFYFCVVCSSSISSDSDYPFGIFKLFLTKGMHFQQCK